MRGDDATCIFLMAILNLTLSDRGDSNTGKTKMNLTEIFGKFAGREVPLNETSQDIEIGDETFKIYELSLKDPNDPTLKEISDEAEKHGLSLRVFWPGMVGTADHNMRRLNVTIEQSNDDKWVVSNNFSLG